MNNLISAINNILPSNTQYLVGYANLQGLLPDKYRGFDYAIVLGRKLDDTIIDAIADGPTIEYYNHYEEVNLELSKVVNHLSDEMQRVDHKAWAIEPNILERDID
ncbi:MAG TPA: hypothetical protein ENN23_04625 [Deltaproteobacteria bacterium]|nr:hypothetical protein [Deltaproteobacteria bacterium]